MGYQKKILFESLDGPDGLCLYTSEDKATVDFSSDTEALYLEVWVSGAHVKLGPFLKKVRLDLEAALAK